MLSGMVKEEEKEALRTDLIGLATEYTPISIIGSGGNINKLFRLADKKDKKASLLPIESLQDIYERDISRDSYSCKSYRNYCTYHRTVRRYYRQLVHAKHEQA